MLGYLYLISLVVGGILLVASLLGDVLDIDAFSDGPDPGGLHILTIRGATYFAFVFGASGAGLQRLAPGMGALPTLAIALVAGVGTATLIDRIFAFVKRGEVGDMEGDRSLHGLVGEVVVPLSARHDGKIAVRRGSERLELLARPFDRDDGDPAGWKHVIIIDIRDGTALVSPGDVES